MLSWSISNCCRQQFFNRPKSIESKTLLTSLPRRGSLGGNITLTLIGMEKL